MLRIAVVDDENEQINILDGYIQRISSIYPDLEYNVFYSGEELLKDYSFMENSYDIILLDIKMEGRDGLQIANKIREVDGKTIIIFITNHKQYVFDGYEPDAFRYILKPLLYEQFLDMFRSAYQEIQKRIKPLVIKFDRKRIRIYPDKIIYCESLNRQILIHTTDGVHKTTLKLQHIKEQLNNMDFIFTHKSFLLNMNYISEIGFRYVKLQNEEEIPVSVSRLTATNEEYLKFLTRG